jgi:hypothetical protein
LPLSSSIAGARAIGACSGGGLHGLVRTEARVRRWGEAELATQT